MHPGSTGRRSEFSARRLALTVLAVLLLAAAGGGGVAYGYQQGKDGTAEYYQPRVADLQAELAAARGVPGG